MREEGVRDGGEAGLCQLPVDTHALQEHLLVVRSQAVPQPLVGGEIPGYECEADVLESFHAFSAALRRSYFVRSKVESSGCGVSLFFV